MKQQKQPERGLASFQERINYRYKDIRLLDEALTHPSLANELGLSFDNQRLEFLGDAVLELVASERLFKADRGLDEGALTRARSQLVRKTSLYKWAEHVGIRKLLRYGKSIGSGGVTQAMAADAAEAVFGAAFIDGGYEAVRTVIGLYLDFTSGEIRQETDPKTELQELLQAEGVGVPYYKLVSKKGPDHALHFNVKVTLGDVILGIAWGTTMKEAEFEAARAALAFLKKNEQLIKKPAQQ